MRPELSYTDGQHLILPSVTTGVMAIQSPNVKLWCSRFLDVMYVTCFSPLIFKNEQTTFGFLQGGKPVDPTELEAFLDEYLVSNFATEADDESPYEVVTGILLIW